MQARISQLDKSNYYKGLLILVGKDRIVDPHESRLMLRIGEILDFDRRFCQAAIDDLLHNKYLIDEPIIFSSRKIAESFLWDAMRLAFTEKEIHPRELDWLKTIAQANQLEDGWLEAEIQRLREMKEPLDLAASFHIQQHLQ